ncbi:hypothetical protein AVEN_144613-1 [Araneus ventricosus]|uniref:Uncharacterized protein n=1 Tax=Araneus ventricosus TaxID=182803 RepID=A0A4Y2BZ45_ARAVE|nr:hypothetical protein AVEN_144613-1 [Araneus ventricosus]
MTSELALLSLSSRTTPTGWCLTTTCELAPNWPHKMGSGFESGILQPRSQGFANRPQRPPCSCKLHGIHRPLSSTLVFRLLLKPRRFLQS